MTDLEFQVNAYVAELISELETHQSVLAVVPNRQLKEMIADKIPMSHWHRIQIVVNSNDKVVVRKFMKPVEHCGGKSLNNGEKEE